MEETEKTCVRSHDAAGRYGGRQQERERTRLHRPGSLDSDREYAVAYAASNSLVPSFSNPPKRRPSPSRLLGAGDKAHALLQLQARSSARAERRCEHGGADEQE